MAAQMLEKESGITDPTLVPKISRANEEKIVLLLRERSAEEPEKEMNSIEIIASHWARKHEVETQVGAKGALDKNTPAKDNVLK